MGSYTEIIFGVSLKSNTPKDVIDSLKFIIGKTGIKPDNCPFEDSIFLSSSYYFGVNKPINKIWFDEVSNQCSVSIRCSLQNYKGEIAKFLSWIKPYIDSGSGSRNMYAIVMYEVQSEPVIYCLNN